MRIISPSPLTAVFAVAALVSGCTEPPAAPSACDGVSAQQPDRARIVPRRPAGLAPSQGVLRIAGTAEHTTRAAIHRVTVAGIAAVQDQAGNNFASWHADVPVEQLQALEADAGVPDDAGVFGARTVTVEVRAYDTCGDTPAGQAQVPVAIRPPGDDRVGSLVIEAADVLPGGNRASLVRVVANPGAAGAGVSVEVIPQDVLRIAGDRTRFVLEGDSRSSAVATIPVEARQAGRATIVARGGSQVATRTVTIDAGPELTPSEARLGVGQSVGVRPTSAFGTLLCRLTDTAAFQASVDGVRLGEMDRELRPSGTPQRYPIITVERLATGPSDAAVPLRCTDPEGQVGRATISTAGSVSEPVSRLEFVPQADAPPFIPADGATPYPLLIEANAEAAGAEVSLRAIPGGTFDGASGVLRFGPAREGRTQLRVFFRSRMPGIATVIARAGGLSDVTTVRVVGAPSIVAATTTLRAGQSTAVLVASEGALLRCFASPSEAFTVTAPSAPTDRQNLMTTGVTPPTGSTGRLELRVERTTRTGPATTVTCTDVSGQSATQEFRADAS